MRDAPIHCFVQLVRAVVVLAVMALAVVARQYVLAVSFGLIFLVRQSISLCDMPGYPLDLPYAQKRCI